MNTEVPDLAMWGLDLEQWKAIAEAQRLNLEQLRAQNNELKSLLARAADMLANVLPVTSGGSKITVLSLIAELRKAAE